MRIFSWYCTIFFSLLGGLIAFVGIAFASGAPQEAAAAAAGLACAVIPYCISRALTEIKNIKQQETELRSQRPAQSSGTSFSV